MLGFAALGVLPLGASGTNLSALGASASVETLSVSDDRSQSLLVVGGRSETGSTADAASDSLQAAAALLETATAAENFANTTIVVATVTESGAAVDSTRDINLNLVANAGAATDLPAVVGSLGGNVAEPGFIVVPFGLGVAPLGFAGYFPAAVDFAQNTAIMLGAVAEAGSPTDAPVAVVSTRLHDVVETVTATDALSVYPGVRQENFGTAQDAIEVGVLSTGPFTATVVALLKGDTVNIGYGVLFDFLSGPVAVWQGIGPLDGRLFGAPIFMGLGNFGKIGAVELGTVAATQQVTFELSGLDAGFYAETQNQATEVRGRRCALYVLVFDADNRLFEVRKRRVFLMDKIVKKVSMDANPPTFSLSLSCEPLLASKNKAPWTFLTDADQRARYPADRALERMQLLTNKRTLVWN